MSAPPDAPASAAGLPPRGVDVPPFYTSLIARQAADLKLAGRAIVAMHFGQPSEGTPPGARAAAARALAPFVSRIRRGVISRP
jgi:hypothetical protein